MGGRPAILFPLFAEITGLSGVGPKSAEALARADITHPRDLIFTLPRDGRDRRLRDSVLDVGAGEIATVDVNVGAHRPPARKGQPYRIHVEDARTAFTLVWFHGRDAYLKGLLPEGSRRRISGKVEPYDHRIEIVHPDHVLPLEDAEDIPAFEPVYPLTQGLTPRVMSKAVAAALTRAPDLPEWIDPGFLARKRWPGWLEAVQTAHHPRDLAELRADSPAWERLAYDEFLAHQLTLLLARAQTVHTAGRVTEGDGRLRQAVRNQLEFELTAAQARSCDEIARDMASDNRMYRLLQGDVGSGKTLVAFLSLLIAVEAGGQAALMAPTEILVRQHYDALYPLARAAGVSLDILTGRDTGAARTAKLAALRAGETDILLGTHAIFQKDVTFADLRLAVVDEQHRFGVHQRLELAAKGMTADVLVMTATPIPRSLALTQYGDMALSVIDEKPPGRQPVQTALVSSARMDDVVAHLLEAIASGRQAYWVCPLVEDSETVDMVAAEARFSMLQTALGPGRVGLVHGRMAPADKDTAMRRFIEGETEVLVATTVIEVGVNVPNASIMVIEQAERFGLSQLHQLRGRVGRGAARSTCLLLYHAPLSETAARRLQILRDTEDGFRIAEEDLAIRGYGDLIGTAQSGMPRFRIADPEHQTALMAAARDDARVLLGRDPKLETSRGAAARILLWLLEQDKALIYLGAG
ncbi:MAG: ATP-dependent DNA helicase RecG [Pseudomonadota bacterium]